MSKEVIVIGAGAAGMMAAGTAAENGHSVTLIEKNNTYGKKLLITGKGRCNLTNACDSVNELLKNVVTNPRFLYSAFYGFDNFKTIEFFEALSVKTKVERGNRVFPQSDKSKDIADALFKYVTENGVKYINDEVTSINQKDGYVSSVICKNGEYKCDSVILATGGLSYPVTGSTGDGYKFARELGHTVTPLSPSLVPICVSDKRIYALSGLSLKNISIKLINSKNKIIYSDFGEMMFAHFGLTGPVILSASSYIKDNEVYRIEIDLKPALSEKQLDDRILRDFSENMNKDFGNSLNKLLPKALISYVVELSEIDPHKKINSVTSAERQRLTKLLKCIQFEITGLRPINEAIITSGGINVKEINPSTMESKLVSGLYFAGEIIDVDALTGGFNLQIAFSTGHLAGLSC